MVIVSNLSVNCEHLIFSVEDSPAVSTYQTPENIKIDGMPGGFNVIEWPMK